MRDSPLEVVRSWNLAANEGNVEAVVALTHQDFEMVTLHRGTKRGHEALRGWMQQQSHGVGMQSLPRRYFHRGGTVVVDALVEMRWVETGELAESRDGAVAFVVRDGLVSSLTVYPGLAAAFEATGLDERANPEDA